MKVMIGLWVGSGLAAECTRIHKGRTYEYHSHAEYSVLMRRERVLRPLCVVLDVAIMAESWT